MTQTAEAAAVWIPIGDLKPWDQNPRQNDHAVAGVATSIERFGFASPIIARLNGEVIAGHTRLKAAQSLGLDRVPVRYMDLDPADAKLLALADNKISELADWDEDALAQILQGLSKDGVDIEGLGWTDEELVAYLEEATLDIPDGFPLVDPSDQAQEVLVEIRIPLGVQDQILPILKQHAVQWEGLGVALNIS